MRSANVNDFKLSNYVVYTACMYKITVHVFECRGTFYSVFDTD